MFIINEALQPGVSAPYATPSSRRYYRSRNCAAASAGNWHIPPELPNDQPDWSEIFEHSVHAGTQAVRKSLIPACLVWSMMAMVAIAYYFVPTAAYFFIGLDRIQNSLGRLFPFLGMGLSVGLLAEAVRVFTSKDKRWTHANTMNASFNLMTFGILGLFQNLFYIQQTRWFGNEPNLSTLACKVMVGQFVWTVLFANPYQTILFILKENHFKFSQLYRSMRPFKTFWGMRVLPVLITNWFFWIPMSFIIYSFPSRLQLPFAILAVTIWVLLLTVLTSNQSKENEDNN